eukprot:TRINITY_DN6645_c0_g1_i2.p1 TRINITY_DN6645_c0_g1~~TRINITY_DN6645_c0_g1_i2.p1  ORF type:complete len:353 (+),score=61.00 TRINITY_DN6645_c0_g1_i2:271-1329(+)
MASCDVASSPSGMADTPSIAVSNELDPLQQAIAAHQTFDLSVLAQEPGVVEFCQTQCFYLEEAKLVMVSVSQGLPSSSSHPLVLKHYVPFLSNYTHYQREQQYPDGELAPGVSYVSAGCCLQHLLQTDPHQAASDIILAPLFSLPRLSEQTLVNNCLMLLHSRSCTNAACGQGFCAGLKQVLAQADCDNDDYRTCVQLERHLRRNKDNPDDPIAGQVMQHVRQAEEAQRRLQEQQAASMLTHLAARNTRSARSFSMPPKVDMSRMQAQQEEQSQVWQGAKPMLKSFPGGQAASYLAAQPGQEDASSATVNPSNALDAPSSPRLGRGRNKSHSMPSTRTDPDAMDDEEDSEDL